jgi:hypothetical protein
MMNFTIQSVSYKSVDNSIVDAVVLVDDYAVELASINLSADAIYPIAIKEWIAAGNTPAPYVAPVPTSVSQRQARLALLGAGLLDQVETIVTAAGGAAKITWDWATEITRHDPMVSTLGPALGLSDAQIDALFVTASTL